MLGILFLLAVSWLLLHFILKENLRILGVQLNTKRLREFMNGFFVTALLCVFSQYGESFLNNSTWNLNDAVNPASIFAAAWWDFKSVLTEELLFRGALLYILIEKIGVRKSLLLSAAAFGIYHWFSFGILGRIVPMVIVFLGTGIMGYAWALAFSKTKSIVLPIALHFGWNFTQNTIFSKGPLGDLLLLSSGGIELSGLLSLVSVLLPMLVMPILTFLYVKYLVPTSEKKLLIPQS